MEYSAFNIWSLSVSFDSMIELYFHENLGYISLGKNKFWHMWLGKIGLAKTAIGKNGHWQKWIGKFGREPLAPSM